MQKHFQQLYTCSTSHLITAYEAPVQPHDASLGTKCERKLAAQPCRMRAHCHLCGPFLRSVRMPAISSLLGPSGFLRDGLGGGERKGDGRETLELTSSLQMGKLRPSQATNLSPNSLPSTCSVPACDLGTGGSPGDGQQEESQEGRGESVFHLQRL